MNTATMVTPGPWGSPAYMAALGDAAKTVTILAADLRELEETDATWGGRALWRKATPCPWPGP